MAGGVFTGASEGFMAGLLWPGKVLTVINQPGLRSNLLKSLFSKLTNEPVPPAPDSDSNMKTSNDNVSETPYLPNEHSPPIPEEKEIIMRKSLEEKKEDSSQVPDQQEISPELQPVPSSFEYKEPDTGSDSKSELTQVMRVDVRQNPSATTRNDCLGHKFNFADEITEKQVLYHANMKECFILGSSLWNLNSHGIRVLMQLIIKNKCTSLEMLSSGIGKWNDEQLTAFTEELVKTDLIYLDLACNELNLMDEKKIIQLITAIQKSKIQILSVRNNKLSIMLCPILLNLENSQVREFNFDQNDLHLIPIENMESTGDALAKTPIEIFKLSWNKLGDIPCESVKKFTNGFAKSKVTTLNIGCNVLNKWPEEQAIGFLSSFSTIQILDLDSNYLFGLPRLKHMQRFIPAIREMKFKEIGFKGNLTMAGLDTLPGLIIKPFMGMYSQTPQRLKFCMASARQPKPPKIDTAEERTRYTDEIKRYTKSAPPLARFFWNSGSSAKDLKKLIFDFIREPQIKFK